MRLFWLSFVDEDRFLGATIIRDTTDILTSVKVAHHLKLNPGGAVAGYPIALREGVKPIPDEYVERLLSIEDINRLMKVIGSDEHF
jgi:hypothetical protein